MLSKSYLPVTIECGVGYKQAKFHYPKDNMGLVRAVTNLAPSRIM